MAAKVDHKEAKDLATYGQVIIQLARKHEGKGWLAYGSFFRQHMAAGAQLSWTDLNPSLVTATLLPLPLYIPHYDRYVLRPFQV